jgi:putative tryptophan/tyrosine transport system substrate-binding protein
MRRREFMALLAAVVATRSLAARAQQPAMPVIGFLNGASSDGIPFATTAFRQGLRETGYVEGQNVAVEYRWANNQLDRLAPMTADLVQRQVNVIVAGGTPAALAAKAATTIPIVFETSADPIQLGLVASLDRPGGNMTGVTQLNVEVAPKRLELLRELLPAARVIALLINPADTVLSDAQMGEVRAAARAFGVDLPVLKASSERELDAAFLSLAQLRAEGLVVAVGGLFTTHAEQLAKLTMRHAMPAIYKGRESLGPDVIVAQSTLTLAPLRERQLIFLSCFCKLLILPLGDLLRAWRGLVAMLQALPSANIQLAPKCWRF